MADLTVELRQVGDGPTSEGVARQHRTLIDRPESKGGRDQGPMGGELLLLALGGCFMSNLIAAAKARGVRVDGMGVTVRGALGTAPPRFEAIEMTVHGSGPDDATLDKLIQIAERGCIVHNTLAGGVRPGVRRAGAPVPSRP
jgi:putative redox protein